MIYAIRVCACGSPSSGTTQCSPSVLRAGLHDGAEAGSLHPASSPGGEATLAEIREKFGDEVASIVRECSDTVVTPKPPWRERKENYVNHLSEASGSAVLVSLADKLHNAHAILRDFRAHGDELWQRFSVKHPSDHLWYYKSLLAAYTERYQNWMVDELTEVINALEAVIEQSTPEV